MHAYDAVMPLAMPDSAIREKIFSDLNNYLGIHARIEQRKIRCYILQRIPGRAISTLEQKDKNLPLPTLVGMWQQFIPALPFN